MKSQVSALFKAILLVGWFMLASTMVSIGVELFTGNPANYQMVITEHRYAISLASQILCFVGLVIFTANQPVIKQEKQEIHIKLILRYVIMGLGAWLMCIIVTQVLIPFFPEYEAINELFSNNEIILRFIVLVIMAPFLEEYLFRGKMQAYLKEGFGATFAIVIQAILFGSLHQLGLQKIYSTFMGLVFGIVREREGNFLSTFIMHMVINFIGWYVGSFVGRIL